MTRSTAPLPRTQTIALLGSAALMMTLAMGMRQNLGLFQKPAAGTGIAVSDFAFAVAVQQVAWGLTQPFAGMLADRFGTRWVAMPSALLLSLFTSRTAATSPCTRASAC